MTDSSIMLLYVQPMLQSQSTKLAHLNLALLQGNG
ncbi:hypothetical protein FHS16_001712 [Paenibacillus endophyticus]|uniref:Uncharacterized protein n=1 Tax=Paenibacillus endophyticus TaxID=1294268 RepID=A0A7W5C5Q8_9BACL|nr:hypothetical protein [Paenibacillus endophyticus]